MVLRLSLPPRARSAPHPSNGCEEALEGPQRDVQPDLKADVELLDDLVPARMTHEAAPTVARREDSHSGGDGLERPGWYEHLRDVVQSPPYDTDPASRTAAIPPAAAPKLPTAVSLS